MLLEQVRGMGHVIWLPKPPWGKDIKSPFEALSWTLPIQPDTRARED